MRVDYGKYDLLLKYLKKIDINLKIILLSHQNNYVQNLSIMKNTAKSFDVNNQFECPTLFS